MDMPMAILYLIHGNVQTVEQNLHVKIWILSIAQDADQRWMMKIRGGN